jgi:glutamate synthase (NADPH) small chain
MPDPKGFLKHTKRETPPRRPVPLRLRDWKEVYEDFSHDVLREQAARCMDCGIPFCHNGCPLGNLIPEWNDLVRTDRWRDAIERLHATNNFPEFTGRLCPAPCEGSCVLGINQDPVTIKQVEVEIIDNAFDEGWVVPLPPDRLTGKRVAVVGSGPAGLAAAQQLTRAGHEVTVFERDDRIGGLLRYGIPEFKMEKRHIDRRVAQMEQEGVTFHYGVNVGVTKPFEELTAEFDAVLLAGGAEDPRDPKLPGQDLAGVHFAMPYLVQQNRRVGQEEPTPEAPILAGGKHVVVIGGGDTASDCVGTSFRQGALSVTQLDIRPKPPVKEDKLTVWPYWPTKMRTSSSQAEGAEREFQAATLGIEGKNGKVTGVKCARVDEKRVPIPGSEFILRADLVFLAIGFAGSQTAGMIEASGVALDRRNNVVANEQDYRTSQAKVFAAGDMRRGQSLVVWAIREGRQAAHAIDLALMGETILPR